MGVNEACYHGALNDIGYLENVTEERAASREDHFVSLQVLSLTGQSHINKVFTKFQVIES